MKISLFRDGYQNVISTETIEDWAEFVDLVIQPQLGQKNGDYFVRGFCDGPRADANMKTLDLIIIDGDQLLDNGHTCCPPGPVHEVMVSAGITHVIYSSYSNDLINNRHKWRLCIPSPDIVDQETLVQGVAEVITLLQQNNATIRNVNENNVLSQPWFLPRCADEGRLLDFYYTYHDGEPWTLTGQVIDSAKILYESKEVPNSEAGNFSMEYVIGQFRAGTLHQGIKSLCGWYIRTTDWQDSQIKAHLVPIIRGICPDQEKVMRACEGKEIDQLIKYCRQKAGVVEHASNWKDNLITADFLRDKEFPPVKWAVDGIIPEGLSVLAGEPKVGKSLIAVDVCSAIASGVKAFETRKCIQGSVCYISLEDPERRVKERIKKQCDLWPSTFKILMGGLPQLGEGFYRLVDEMSMLWPDLRAIVIDTMQFIIPEKKNGISDYEHYYKFLDPLHRWALTNHIAVILITHTVKSRAVEGDNPFSAIIGSVAIQGCSDAMLLLKKNHAKGTIVDPVLADGFLTIVGRELGNGHYSLEWNSEDLKWSMIGETKVSDQTANPNYLLISSSLEKKPKKAMEIVAEAKINRATVMSCLRRMITSGIINKNDDLTYGLVGKNYELNKSVW